MTLCELNDLPHSFQLYLTYFQGTLLARRWELGVKVNLYYLPGGPFVEVYISETTQHLEQLYPFTHMAPLEQYVRHVQLPPECY